MKKKLIITFYIIFFIFLILYLFGKLNPFDNFVYNNIIKFKSNITTNILKFITFFGGSKFGISIMILLLVFYFIKKKIPILSILIFINFSMNMLVKLIIKRDRPIDINIITEKFYSFPSGHTMFSITLYGFIIYLINNSKLNKNIKILLISLLIILIILIMISRIYLGVHYASDVLAGLFLSLANLLLCIEIIERKKLL